MEAARFFQKTNAKRMPEDLSIRTKRSQGKRSFNVDFAKLKSPEKFRKIDTGVFLKVAAVDVGCASLFCLAASRRAELSALRNTCFTRMPTMQQAIEYRSSVRPLLELCA